MGAVAVVYRQDAWAAARLKVQQSEALRTVVGHDHTRPKQVECHAAVANALAEDDKIIVRIDEVPLPDHVSTPSGAARYQGLAIRLEGE